MFTPYRVDKSDIKALSDTIYLDAVNKNDFESLCYSIYFAIRFDFVLDAFENNYIKAQDYVIRSKDCLLLTMTWIYFMKQNHWKRDSTQVKPLNRFAMELKNTDMDRYWLFCYEALSYGSLSGQWRSMKQAGISFIRKEIIDQDYEILREYDKHVSNEVLMDSINNNRIIVMFENNNFIGWLRYNLFWDNIPFMSMLYFLDGERRKGYGTKLVDFWENEMKLKGFEIVLTSTQSNEDAQFFYRKRGYKDCGSLVLPDEPLEIILYKNIK